MSQIFGALEGCGVFTRYRNGTTAEVIAEPTRHFFEAICLPARGGISS
jgi:hypothetical protein